MLALASFFYEANLQLKLNEYLKSDNLYTFGDHLSKNNIFNEDVVNSKEKILKIDGVVK